MDAAIYSPDQVYGEAVKRAKILEEHFQPMREEYKQKERTRIKNTIIAWLDAIIHDTSDASPWKAFFIERNGVPIEVFSQLILDVLRDFNRPGTRYQADHYGNYYSYDKKNWGTQLAPVYWLSHPRIPKEE